MMLLGKGRILPTLAALSVCGSGAKAQSSSPSDYSVDGVDKFSAIIVGGGTAGCTTAYFLAKWMEDHRVPGTVLLIDRGVDFACPVKGPSNKIDAWFLNWGIYGEAHSTIRQDGSDYPVVATDHRGLGGCGTHDTRITFQLRPEQKFRMAQSMGWSREQLDVYYQAALNLMPLTRAIQKKREVL